MSDNQQTRHVGVHSRRSTVRTRIAGAALGERGQHADNAHHTDHREFGDLDVAVITDSSTSGEQLVRELQRTRARVQHLWPPPELIPTSCDVVYCNLLSDLPQRLPWLPGEPDAALVVIIAAAQPVDLTLLHNCSPDAVICQPVAAQQVRSSLVVARDHFLHQKRLRKRIDKLDETLRTMRNVERAKAVLMSSRKISEEEAYHYMRRQAMQRQVTIGVLANVIVDSQGLLS